MNFLKIEIRKKKVHSPEFQNKQTKAPRNNLKLEGLYDEHFKALKKALECTKPPVPMICQNTVK